MRKRAVDSKYVGDHSNSLLTLEKLCLFLCLDSSVILSDFLIQQYFITLLDGPIHLDLMSNTLFLN